jgi:hypothetical protein
MGWSMTSTDYGRVIGRFRGRSSPEGSAALRMFEISATDTHELRRRAHRTLRHDRYFGQTQRRIGPR